MKSLKVLKLRGTFSARSFYHSRDADSLTGIFQDHEAVFIGYKAVGGLIGQSAEYKSTREDDLGSGSNGRLNFARSRPWTWSGTYTTAPTQAQTAFVRGKASCLAGMIASSPGSKPRAKRATIGPRCGWNTAARA